MAVGCLALFLLALFPWPGLVHDALNIPLRGMVPAIFVCVVVTLRFARQVRKPHRPRWYSWVYDIFIVGPVILYTYTYSMVGPLEGHPEFTSVLMTAWIVAGLLLLSDVVFPFARVLAQWLDALIDAPWGVPLVVVILTVASSLLGTLEALRIFG
jgi:hypothetical protein